MTHDPLCAKSDHYCVCDLIAEVRKDERQKTFDADWSEIGQLAAVGLFRRQAARDMLAKCIAALPHDTHCLDTWYDDKTSECFCESAACDRALRALQEVDTPQQEINEHINFDTANRIGDDTTLQNAGREPYKSPNGYDPRAAENRP
jgi:hypothetical protein